MFNSLSRRAMALVAGVAFGVAAFGFASHADDAAPVPPVITIGAPINGATEAEAKAAVATAPLGSTVTATSADGVQVTFKPLIEALLPYIVTALGGIITALATLIVAKINKSTNMKINDQNVSTVIRAFQTEAGAMAAGAADNLGKKVFTIKSPEVAAAIVSAEKRIPDAIQALKNNGASPEDLQKIMVGEIGKLQATSAAPVVVAAAPGDVVIARPSQ